METYYLYLNGSRLVKEDDEFYDDDVPPIGAYLNSDELSEKIDLINKDLLIILVKKGWVTQDGKIYVAEGYEHIGSNIFTSNLDELFTVDEESGTLVLSEDMAKRFVDNRDVSALTDLQNTQKQLRIRYGDKVVEGMINRLIRANFSYDTMMSMAVPVEVFAKQPPFSEQFLDGWWLIYAYQNVMLSVQNGLI